MARAHLLRLTYSNRLGLHAIIRAHETAREGYEENYMNKRDQRDEPYVVTVFSAPNYCGCYDNKAAVLHITEERLEYKQYESVPQPFVLPKNLNGALSFRDRGPRLL